MNKVFPKKQKDKDSQINPNSASSIASTSSSKDYHVCRICQTEKEPPDFLLKNKKVNQQKFTELINPCLCSGSMKFVHRECLQHWISASKAKKCELCLYPFKIKVRPKPIHQWQLLPLSSLEQKRIFLTVLFQLIAMICSIWSLSVLINKTSEEIVSFKLSWSLWIKLLVIALGLTGLSLFIWIQLRLYLSLLFKWRSHNKEYYVVSPSEKELEEARRQRSLPKSDSEEVGFYHTNNSSETFHVFEIFRSPKKTNKNSRRIDEHTPLTAHQPNQPTSNPLLVASELHHSSMPEEELSPSQANNNNHYEEFNHCNV